jgi:hypothetical protein
LRNVSSRSSKWSSWLTCNGGNCQYSTLLLLHIKPSLSISARHAILFILVVRARIWESACQLSLYRNGSLPPLFCKFSSAVGQQTGILPDSSNVPIPSLAIKPRRVFRVSSAYRFTRHEVNRSTPPTIFKSTVVGNIILNVG